MKQNIEVKEIRKELVQLRIKQTKLMARAAHEQSFTNKIFKEDQMLQNQSNSKKVGKSIEEYWKANHEASVIERQIRDLTLLLQNYK